MSDSANLPLELAHKWRLYESLPSEHEQAIEQDVEQECRVQAFFSDNDVARAQEARRDLCAVLKAYALYDPEVGYVRGMQFIVLPLVLMMCPYEAFKTLVALMQTQQLRTNFLPDQFGLKIRLYQFSRLIEETMPRLYAHMARKEGKTDLFTTPWFLFLFCQQCPPTIMLGILDVIFAGGIESIFPIALALFRANEPTLLSLELDQIDAFINHDIFTSYRLSSHKAEDGNSFQLSRADGRWLEQNYAVRRLLNDSSDARSMATPNVLARYALEYQGFHQRKTAPLKELCCLQENTWRLAAKVQEMEEDASSRQVAHVELMNNLVTTTLVKDELTEDLARYKTLYADLSLAQAQAQTVSHTIAPAPPLSRSLSHSNSGSGSRPITPGILPSSSASASTRISTRVSGSGSTRPPPAKNSQPDRSGHFSLLPTLPPLPAAAQSMTQSMSATVITWGRWLSRGSRNIQPSTLTLSPSSGTIQEHDHHNIITSNGATNHTQDTGGVITPCSTPTALGQKPGHIPLPPPLPPRRRQAAPLFPSRKDETSSSITYMESVPSSVRAASITPSEGDHEDHMRRSPGSGSPPVSHRSRYNSFSSDMETVSLQHD